MTTGPQALSPDCAQRSLPPAHRPPMARGSAGGGPGGLNSGSDRGWSRCGGAGLESSAPRVAAGSAGDSRTKGDASGELLLPEGGHWKGAG